MFKDFDRFNQWKPEDVFTVVLTVVLTVSFGLLASCRVSPPDSPPSPNADQDLSPTTPFSTVPSASPLGGSVTVKIYSIDETCESLVPSEMLVPADRVMEASIASVLSRSSPKDLSPLAYSINLNRTTGQATLDLRPTPSSAQRSLQSLSSCEQLALFGSLQETLLSHREWGIKSVQFTENGEPLLL